MSSPSAANIGRLFRFPRYNARREKQEKAGEEHREEYEQIDMQLILTEKYDTEASGAVVCVSCSYHYVEFRVR